MSKIRAESLRALRERPSNPDAIDLAMRGWAVRNEPATETNRNEAIDDFERALRLDPGQPEALTGLSRSLSEKIIYFWSANPAEDADRAGALASEALSAHPDSAEAHLARAVNSFVKRQWDTAIDEAEAAIADDRNLAHAYASAGFYKLFSGRAAEGFAGVETALRLSPRDPLRYSWEYDICHMHTHLAQWDEAIEWCRKSVATHPIFWAYVDLAAAYAWTGRDMDARAAVEELQKVKPGYTVQQFATIKWTDNPTFNAQYARIAEGLRKAGLPEGEKPADAAAKTSN